MRDWDCKQDAYDNGFHDGYWVGVGVFLMLIAIGGVIATVIWLL